MSVAQALSLDGNGVVYYRSYEAPDRVVEQLGMDLGWPPDKVEEGKEAYWRLQESAFSQEIGYTDMLSQFAGVMDYTSPQAVDHIHDLVQRFSAEIQIDPDLTLVLSSLRERSVKIAMITNSIHPASVKRSWLEQDGVGDLFDVIFSSIDVRVRKPDPEIFRQFAAKVSLPPEQIVYVGHDEKEVVGAKSAGFISVCLRCACRQADHAIQRFGEVLDLPLWP